MTVPDMAVSDNKFILAERYIRVDAPDDSGFAGFWCEVRQNLSNGERRLLIERLDELGAQAVDRIEASRTEQIAAQLKEGATPEEQRAMVKRMNELTEQMNAVADESRVQRWSLVAPHIRDWNAYEGDPPQRIDPPQVAGIASLDAVTQGMADWITQELLQAYRSGKGVLNRSTPPGGSGRPTGGPKVPTGKGTKRNTPAHLTSSSGLSASPFQA
jgi:hypothetical protein